MPADSYAALAASTSRSSRPLSQCSTKLVHPMPTIATRSLMPWLPIAHQPSLPEVVDDAVRGVQPPERHLYSLADLDLVGVGVGELDRETATAVEVDHREHDRRARRVHHPVD